VPITRGNVTVQTEFGAPGSAAELTNKEAERSWRNKGDAAKPLEVAASLAVDGATTEQPLVTASAEQLQALMAPLASGTLQGCRDTAFPGLTSSAFPAQDVHPAHRASHQRLPRSGQEPGQLSLQRQW
jgi:hypothetical protein